MNFTLGLKLSDGRRVGIEWRRRNVARGTVLQACLTHEGELSPDDLDACLAEIGACERFACASVAPARHARRRKCS
jgi:hypothetical protein